MPPSTSPEKDEQKNLANKLGASTNNELKNSMFENVFGYKSQTLNKAQDDNQPSFGPSKSIYAGLDMNQPLPLIMGENKSNLPEVILDQPHISMRASADQESARVIMETRVIQNLIFSYFNIVKKNISDMVPKTIMAFLINESKKNAHSELVSQIYKAGDLDSLLVEDPMVVEQRDRTRKVIHALRSAQEILGEVAKFDI